MCVDVECYVLFGFDFRSHSLMMLYLSVQVLIDPSLLPVCVGCQPASTPPDVRARMNRGDAEDRIAGLWQGVAPLRPGVAFAKVFKDAVFEEESDTGSAEVLEDHYGLSGRSCGCCRAANPEDWPSGCDICLDLWWLSIVDKRFRLFVSRQAGQATGSAAVDGVG